MVGKGEMSNVIANLKLLYEPLVILDYIRGAQAHLQLISAPLKNYNNNKYYYYYYHDFLDHF